MKKTKTKKSHATTFMQTLSNVESSCLVQKAKIKRKISSTVSFFVSPLDYNFIFEYEQGTLICYAYQTIPLLAHSYFLKCPCPLNSGFW
jgi:hypothetical protein